MYHPQTFQTRFASNAAPPPPPPPAQNPFEPLPVHSPGVSQPNHPASEHRRPRRRRFLRQMPEWEPDHDENCEEYWNGLTREQQEQHQGAGKIEMKVGEDGSFHLSFRDHFSALNAGMDPFIDQEEVGEPGEHSLHLPLGKTILADGASISIPGSATCPRLELTLGCIIPAHVTQLKDRDLDHPNLGMPAAPLPQQCPDGPSESFASSGAEPSVGGTAKFPATSIVSSMANTSLDPTVIVPSQVDATSTSVGTQ